jgi:hypothetical protein
VGEAFDESPVQDEREQHGEDRRGRQGHHEQQHVERLRKTSRAFRTSHRAAFQLAATNHAVSRTTIPSTAILPVLSMKTHADRAGII